MEPLITNFKKIDMKRFKTIFVVALVFPLFIFAQEDNDTIVKSEVKLERAAFESTALIDNQTNVLNTKGTLEMVLNHRFGLVDDENSLLGLWSPSNIRIALSYAVHDRVTVGFGSTKDKRLQDFNLKGAILRQTRENEMPVSVTYYGNFTINAKKKENFNLVQDRYSFFNQLIIARRFSPKVSFHVAPSISHYNLVDKNMENDMIAISAGGRVKISPQTSIIAEYSQPITSFEDNNLEPEPGVSLGVEFSTGSHAFQIFVTNYKGIVPQENFMYNQNKFFDGDFMIGFNITRLWHL